MASTESRKKLLKVSALCVVIIAGLLIIFPEAIMLSETRSSSCPYCRAHCLDKKILWWKLAPKIEENANSAYWHSNVDPNHKHIWWCEYYTRRYISGAGVHGDCFTGRRFMLLPEAEIAILSSFKTPAERKAFAGSLFVWDRNKPVAGREAAMVALQNRYVQNPARKDWQKILKQLGVIK